MHGGDEEILMDEEVGRDTVQFFEDMEVTEKSIKRAREETDDDDGEGTWEVVKGKGKKIRQEENKPVKEKESNRNVVYMSSMSSKEPLPKQFAMARLLKSEKITGIACVKYLNPYKIRIEFNEQKDIENLICNDEIRNRKWTIHKLMEVNYSFGVIRDVDIDLKDEEIFKNIVCPEPAELVSVKRLSRRNRDEEKSEDKTAWTPCEAVRLCFRGGFLPTYVEVFDVKIVVEPYVFPVNQCFFCWKLGHVAKACSSRRPTCPKCSGEHKNCETKIYKCPNCSGNHMAMMRECPVFIKEKRIREIMAQNNCTYVKAAQINTKLPTSIIVPATSNRKQHSQSKVQMITHSNNFYPLKQQEEGSHSNVGTHEDGDDRSEKSFIFTTQPDTKKQIKKTKKESRAWSVIVEEEEAERGNQQEDTKAGCYETQEEKKTTFKELLNKIKDVIFLKNLDFQTKLKSVLQLCVEWAMIIAAECMSEWSISKLISGVLNTNG